MKQQQPLLKTEWVDPITQAKGYLVIDQLVNGSCGGGIRMRKGLNQMEVERLAKTMSMKLAVLQMPSGGAKGGIDYDPAASDALGVLERFLEAHRPYLLECWATGEDLGTREPDIVRILSEMGIQSPVQSWIAKHPYPELIPARLKHLSSLQMDGLTLIDVSTGYGVAVSAMSALEELGLTTKSATVAIQGFGSVGASAALYLQAFGCKVLAIADAQGTMYKEEGIEVRELLGKRNKLGIVDRNMLDDSYTLLDREKWIDFPVDILVPAAIADAIHTENVERVQAKLIVEGANIPTTPEAEKILHGRGTHVIPDFIANVGGAGLFGAALDVQVETSVEGVFQYLKTVIGSKTKKVLREAIEKEMTPRDAAM